MADEHKHEDTLLNEEVHEHEHHHHHDDDCDCGCGHHHHHDEDEAVSYTHLRIAFLPSRYSAARSP